MVQVTTRFDDDLKAGLARWLSTNGFDPPKTMTVEGVCHAHYNALWRLISPVPRTVHWSAELRARLGNSPAHVSPGVHMVALKASVGEDLRPHLHKPIRKSDYHDKLLNDWRIHHLHLGTVVGSGGVVGHVENFDEVLFALVTNNEVYLIDVMLHGDDFADDKCIQILHRNWPDFMAQFRAPSAITGLAQKVDLASRKLLRGGNVMSPVIEMPDGVLYMCPGFGYATSGISMQVVSASDRFRGSIRAIEESLRLNADQVAAEIAKFQGRPVEKMSFRLRVNDQADVLVYEEIHGFRCLPTYENEMLIGLRMEPDPLLQAA